VLVTNSTPLNQFIARNPDYFFGAPVEQARINPDNLQILVSHIKCARFELPFTAARPSARKTWRRSSVSSRRSASCTGGGELALDERELPADAVSLRSVSSDNFVVQDVTPARSARHRGSGLRQRSVDGPRERRSTCWKGAAYLVEKYDHAQRPGARARGRTWTTTPTPSAAPGSACSTASRSRRAGAARGHGEVHVASQVVGFKKIRFWSNENVGSGELGCPSTRCTRPRAG
jgi:DEAD/DEAH box helicase domain-containing protein